MRNETISIYKLSELSESAQQKAYQDYLNNDYGYIAIDDAENTLKKFQTYFPVKVNDWQVSSDRYNYKFHVTNTFDNYKEVTEMTGNRLRTWIVNNLGQYLENKKTYYSKNWPDVEVKRKSKILYSNDCPLTGTVYDESILRPIRNFIKNSPDKYANLEDIFKECLEDFFTDWKNEFEYQESFEAFKEMAEANEWEFTEDGKPY